MSQTTIFITILSVIMVFIPTIIARTEWIDPHSMDDDPRLQCNCETNALQDPRQSSIVASYYIRTINIILNSLQYDKEVYSAQYEAALLQEDYIFMQSFLKKNLESIDGEDWDRMDKLLSQIFINKENTFIWKIMSWKDYFYTITRTKEFGVALGVIFLIWFVYKIMHTKFRFLGMVKYFIFVLYIVDYVYTWVYMLKEKELEQLLHITYKVPPECNVKNMNYFSYFKYLADSFKGKDRCAEYHKIKDIDIFWSVSPSQVFGMQIGNLILAPAEKIGNAFSKLISGVFSQASWYMMIPTVLLLPVLLFGLILGGCVLLSFLTGRGFSFNILHLMQFSFGGGYSSNEKQQKINPTINLTLPQVQVHQAIEGKPRKRQRSRSKKTSIEEMVEGNKMPVIQDKRVTVEDIKDSDTEGQGDIKKKSNESDENDDSQRSELEETYEVIS